MKTILQALRDEITYPLGDGFLENRLLARGMDGCNPAYPELFAEPEFLGAVADCLYALIIAPNFSESDISISLQDRTLILKRANSLYKSIGEEEKQSSQPNVWIGFK